MNTGIKVERLIGGGVRVTSAEYRKAIEDAQLEFNAAVKAQNDWLYENYPCLKKVHPTGRKTSTTPTRSQNRCSKKTKNNH
jgi:hypothetical protein